MAISATEREAFRLSVAARETPRALAVTGGCFAAITLVNAAFGPPLALGVLLLNGLAVVFLLGAAALVRTPFMRAGAWPWVAAASAVAVVTVGQVQVWLSPDGASFAYVLLIVVAYGPLTLEWIPAAAAAVPMLVGCIVISRQWPPAAASDWVIASVAAVALGMTMLWIRLRSVNALADLSAQVGALATRDRLTGAFNRLGVEERIPALIGIAQRRQEPVFAMFLDIDGLKAVNDRDGHQAGDALITRVADALRAVVRGGDLVGRWGGDEFIVLGLGEAQHPDVFADRIVEHCGAGTGAGVGKFQISIGAATFSGDGLDVADLIRQADEDMYTRRRARRAT